MTDNIDIPLKTFELTWDDGTVEQVRAHWVGPVNSWIEFRINDQRQAVLIVRPEAIRSIRPGVQL